MNNPNTADKEWEKASEGYNDILRALRPVPPGPALEQILVELREGEGAVTRAIRGAGEAVDQAGSDVTELLGGAPKAFKTRKEAEAFFNTAEPGTYDITIGGKPHTVTVEPD